MPPQGTSKRQTAREIIDILEEISILLNCEIDRTQLSLCVSLVENGVNPEALAEAIKEVKRDAAEAQGRVSVAE